uniref:Uncharacterized protein n=1 Tax=Panagrellus redivivus TaxID=6233 RepID=A0A7E4UM86_PANRE
MSKSFDNDLNDNNGGSAYPGSSDDHKIHIFPRRKVRISEDAFPGGGGGGHHAGSSLTGSMTSLREKLRHPMRQTSIGGYFFLFLLLFGFLRARNIKKASIFERLEAQLFEIFCKLVSGSAGLTLRASGRCR